MIGDSETSVGYSFYIGISLFEDYFVSVNTDVILNSGISTGDMY